MTETGPSHVEPPEIMRPNKALTRGLIVMAVVLAAFAAFALYLNYRPMAFDPTAWRNATSTERARMLESLRDQTDFVGFTRDEVAFYLGPAEFDERLFWYDLGEVETVYSIDPRADVGNPGHLYGVFRHDPGGVILDVLFSHRRPTVGSEPFDSTAWANAEPKERRTMFTSALRTIRNRGLQRYVVTNLLGPPDGLRVRAEYDVGAIMPYTSHRALVIEYGRDNIVDSSFIQK
ncbi:MAG: hypothetical protein GF341_06820 [candidate division Zixibacteria bacterium]|nr:hypothetical protein [candidate division Zixibacteria bacterium]